MPNCISVLPDKSNPLRSTIQERSKMRRPWRLRVTLALPSNISSEWATISTWSELSSKATRHVLYVDNWSVIYWGRTLALDLFLQIINLGKRLTATDSATLIIRWPKHAEPGNRLLYLMDITSTGVKNLECTPKDEINRLNLVSESSTFLFVGHSKRICDVSWHVVEEVGLFSWHESFPFIYEEHSRRWFVHNKWKNAIETFRRGGGGGGIWVKHAGGRTWWWVPLQGSRVFVGNGWMYICFKVSSSNRRRRSAEDSQGSEEGIISRLEKKKLSLVTHTHNKVLFFCFIIYFMCICSH